MEQIILIRYGEIMLKGLNRHSFEERLASNLRRVLADVGRAHIEIAQGRMYILPRQKHFDFDSAAKKAAQVFGVVSASIAWKSDTSHESIVRLAETAALAYISRNKPDRLDGIYTFKIETKRGDKTYPRTSPLVSRETGDGLLELLPELVVDVRQPQFVVNIEIREAAYAYSERVDGFGGLPLGTNGRALLLLSGGIDSPVAGFMMAKRGVDVEGIHFYSFPYTSERSRDKVFKLSEILAGYMGKFRLHIVPFTETQLAIRDNCAEEFQTVVMRRIMIYIADEIAKRNACQALITGEAMGQVASQTIMSLAATNRATEIPIFRPLIGMDKTEVVDYARRIGTFDTSILPYQDCCTVFTPKHPKTKPKYDDVIREESRIPVLKELITRAVDGTEMTVHGLRNRGT